MVFRHDAREAREVARLAPRVAAIADEIGSELAITLPDELIVVLHRRPLTLALAEPRLFGVASMTDAPSRALITGIGTTKSVHCLAPQTLRSRLQGRGPDEREFVRRSVAAALTQHLLTITVPSLARTRAIMGRNAWLSWGAAQWLSGQTEFTNGLIRRRLREVERSAYPPRRGDAVLLGGSVLAFVAQERGRQAALEIIRAGPAGASRALAAVDAAHVAGPWRDFLARRADRAER